ncbi:MAG TPA: serine/threonine-protein kinase, partial [Bryobacteraceae bacterium]|nr:serine/threonine-protein kinase [Bryobacteraceae bacterium]
NRDDEQRFLREIQVQASLHHENIAAVHNAFWTSHGLALVMELADGEPLNAVLARGRVALETGVSYVLQTLTALRYAHEHGVVHRDVKPGNIIVTANGSVKLTDFGVARRMEGPQLTRTGTLTGSPYYMAPEQVTGVCPVDARCDIYAVGVVLYEITTGRRPFEDPSAFEVLLKHRDTAPEPPINLEPAIGRDLNNVILRAMAKDPTRRYQSAAEFHAALQQAFQNRTALKARPPARPLLLKAARCLTVAVLACASVMVPWLVRERQAPPPPNPPVWRLPVPELVAPTPAPEEPEETESPVMAFTAEPKPQPVRPLRFASRVKEPSSTRESPVPPPKHPAMLPSTAAIPEVVRAPEAPQNPKKRRNAIWRGLGAVVRPFLGKPEAQSQTVPVETLADDSRLIR